MNGITAVQKYPSRGVNKATPVCPDWLAGWLTDWGKPDPCHSEIETAELPASSPETAHPRYVTIRPKHPSRSRLEEHFVCAAGVLQVRSRPHRMSEGAPSRYVRKHAYTYIAYLSGRFRTRQRGGSWHFLRVFRTFGLLRQNFVGYVYAF